MPGLLPSAGRDGGVRSPCAYNGAMPTPTSNGPADTADLYWLALCPLLPACTGPVTGAALMLAAAVCLAVCDLAHRLPDPWSREAGPRLNAVLATAGLAGMLDLLLRAFAPQLHMQIAAALPLLVLWGLLPPGRPGAEGRIRRASPALLMVFMLACAHACLQEEGLSGEWRLLALELPSRDAALPWRSPAASLVGLALLLAAANIARTATQRGRAG